MAMSLADMCEKTTCPACQGEREVLVRCSCWGRPSAYHCGRCGDAGLILGPCPTCEGTGTVDLEELADAPARRDAYERITAPCPVCEGECRLLEYGLRSPRECSVCAGRGRLLVAEAERVTDALETARAALQQVFPSLDREGANDAMQAALYRAATR